jgi:hypothetical protein
MTTTWQYPTNYPGVLDDFITNPANILVDLVDEVLANHPNSLASAVDAIQVKLGIDNGVTSGLGGLSFHPTGHATNPGSALIPTIWLDNTPGPGVAWVLNYTDNLGVTVALGSGGGSAVTDWITLTDYVEDQEVAYLNLRFRARADHTAAASFFTDLAYWECMSNEGFVVFQAGHGLVSKDVIYEAAGVWAKARANSISTLSDPPVLIIGANTDYFLAVQDGQVTLAGHGLTVDQVYFLSDATPGLLTTTEPTAVTSFSNPILKVRSSDTLSILPYRPSAVGVDITLQYAFDGGNTINMGAGNIQLTNGKVGIGNASPSALLTLGTAGSVAGSLSLAGSGSGVVTLQTAASAGTYTLTLPTSDGTSNQILRTDGSGVLDWVSYSGIVPTTITVAGESTDTSCFPIFVTAATGDLGPKTSTGWGISSAHAYTGTGTATSGLPRMFL